MRTRTRTHLLVLALAVLAAVLASASAKRRQKPHKSASREESADPGQQAFLTPLLDAGKAAEARNASRVEPSLGGVESFSGFLTVNKTHNSNLFFWFFPAAGERRMEEAPVVLWLVGGLGSSAMFGVFLENGPFKLRKKNKLKRRKQSWTRAASVLYVDAPVGTGFSFTDSPDGYATSSGQIGGDLYGALLQFYQLFPQLRGNELFLAGESYAGKLVPNLAREIHAGNQGPAAAAKVNLKGLAMGNPLCDPETALRVGEHLYQIGLLDDHAKEAFLRKEDEMIGLIKQRRWEDALAARDQLILPTATSTNTTFYDLTGYSIQLNYLHEEEYYTRRYEPYVQLPEVRTRLHVGNATFNTNRTVVSHPLRADIMQSVKPLVEDLLEHYDILFYHGHLDLAVPYVRMVDFLKGLQWSGSKQYLSAPRKMWMVDNSLAGYSKTAGRLTEVLVRAAGHLVVLDQPKWALDLITKFVSHQTI